MKKGIGSYACLLIISMALTPLGAAPRTKKQTTSRTAHTAKKQQKPKKVTTRYPITTQKAINTLDGYIHHLERLFGVTLKAPDYQKIYKVASDMIEYQAGGTKKNAHISFSFLLKIKKSIYNDFATMHAVTNNKAPEKHKKNQLYSEHETLVSLVKKSLKATIKDYLISKGITQPARQKTLWRAIKPVIYDDLYIASYKKPGQHTLFVPKSVIKPLQAQAKKLVYHQGEQK